MMGDSYYFIQVGKAHAYVNDMLVDTYESAGGIGELNILGASIEYKVAGRWLALQIHKFMLPAAPPLARLFGTG